MVISFVVSHGLQIHGRNPNPEYLWKILILILNHLNRMEHSVANLLHNGVKKQAVYLFILFCEHP